MENATNALLDRIARKRGLHSDYALAKLFEAPHQRITNYRKGRTQMDDAVAIRAAEIVGEDPALILAEIHAQRSKSDTARKHWNRIAKLLRADARHHAHA